MKKARIYVILLIMLAVLSLLFAQYANDIVPYASVIGWGLGLVFILAALMLSFLSNT